MKKRLLTSIIAICMLVSLLPTTALAAETSIKPAGTGSSADPYLIESVENLEWLRQEVANGNSFGTHPDAGNNKAYFKQTADIDYQNATVTPIGSFSTSKSFNGIYDGSNHIIKNIKIDANQQGVGFFGKTFTATIKNVHLENASVYSHGKAYVGGIVGHGYATIDNCSFEGSVGYGYQVGGIAGSGGFTITDCKFNGEIKGADWGVGGIVGNRQDGGKIENCYVSGTITASGTSYNAVGGIVGIENYTTISVKGNYVNAAITLNGNTVDTPILGSYNEVENVSTDAYTNNSWNREKIDIDENTVYNGEKNTPVEGVEMPRDNNLIMVESDLQYIDTTDPTQVTIMKSSAVTTSDVENAMAVAVIGDTKYYTIESAVEAVKDGDTITLKKDITVENLTVNNNITLDLNNRQLSGSITNNGNMTVKNGTLWATVEGNAPTYEGAQAVSPAAQVDGVNYATLQEAITAAVASGAESKEIILMADNAEAIAVPASETELCINANGNNLSGSIVNNGKLRFDSDAHAAVSVTNNGTLEITGGATYDLSRITNGESGKIAISGGTFSARPGNDWLVSGYCAASNGSDLAIYTVRLAETDKEALDSGHVAKYESKYYKTVQEGFNNGTTVHLLKDVTEDATRNDGTIYLYCDDYTFTGSLKCKYLYVRGNKAILDEIQCGSFYGGSSSASDYTTDVTVKSGSAGKIKAYKNASITVEDGSFTGAIEVENGGKVTVNDGNFDGNRIAVKAGGSLIINGGYFKVDPSNYLGEDKVVVASDKDGYTYMVTDKAGDIGVDTGVKAGETPEVEVEGTVADQGSAEAAAKAINNNKTKVKGAEDLTPDAGTAANNPEVITQTVVDSAKSNLSADDKITYNETTPVTIVIEPYLDIKVKDAAKEDDNTTIGSITYDISAKYNVLATTATNPANMNKEDVTGKNTVTVSVGNELEVTKPVTITIPLPDGFVADKKTPVYVHHIKDGVTYVYKANIKDDTTKGFTATFTNPHGFSEFVLKKDAAASITVDKVTTYYATLQDAVDAVQDGQTITLLQNDQEATVSKTVTFKVANTGSNDFSAKITGGSRTTVNQSDPVDGITTYTCTRSSGGSGGSVTTYAITTNSPANGTVTASPKSAAKGATVTLTVAPTEGYQLDKLTVADKDGKEITLTDKGNGKYTFTMSASKVEVTATFKQAPVVHVCPSEKYTDVDTTQWYHEGVDYVIANGMMNGTGANLFEPNATTTRGMIVTILYRLEKEPAAGTSPFTDVDAGQWYAKAVAWAAANGVVNGTSPTTFNPNDPITREQMAAILYRYASFKGYDVTQKADLAGFTDVAQISDYAKDPMAWANKEGLIGGVSATTLQPQGSATRAQVATILMRFCENVAK